MRFALLRCLLVVLFSLRAAWSVPTLANPFFASGLTGWSTAGSVSTSTDTLLSPFPYAVVSTGLGVDDVTAEGLLGLNSGGLFGLTNINLVFQDIGGSYTAADTILTGVGGLANSFSPSALGAIGIVDLSSGTLADFQFGPLFFIGPPTTATDGFFFAFGPAAGPLTLNTSGPARLFALIANAGQGENSALAVTFLANEAPELDPGSVTLPVTTLLALFLLVAERRRRLPVPK